MSNSNERLKNEALKLADKAFSQYTHEGNFHGATLDNAIMAVRKALTARKCNCKSHNTGTGGFNNEIVLTPPFLDRTICVDSCIADDLVGLWDAGFVTFGSCCGHNLKKASIIIDPEKAELASSYLKNMSDKEWDVFSWQLIKHK